MPTAKKKAPAQTGTLVRASKINLSQVTILVLLFVVLGVAIKYYSHGAQRTAAAAPNPYVCMNTRPTLSLGSAGDCAGAAQWFLNHMNDGVIANGTYSLTINSSRKSQPVIDSTTVAAIKDFQSRHQLTTNGQVDAPTWKALERSTSTNVVTTYGNCKESLSNSTGLKVGDASILRYVEDATSISAPSNIDGFSLDIYSASDTGATKSLGSTSTANNYLQSNPYYSLNGGAGGGDSSVPGGSSGGFGNITFLKAGNYYLMEKQLSGGQVFYSCKTSVFTVR